MMLLTENFDLNKQHLDLYKSLNVKKEAAILDAETFFTSKQEVSVLVCIFFIRSMVVYISCNRYLCELSVVLLTTLRVNSSSSFFFF